METSQDCHEQFDPANSPIQVERNESSNPLFGTVNVVNLSGDGKINQNAHSAGALLVLGAVVHVIYRFVALGSCSAEVFGSNSQASKKGTETGRIGVPKHNNT